jgi:hypothetical protein
MRRKASVIHVTVHLVVVYSRSVRGTRMSGLVDFQSDAMACLELAERATSQEERAVLVDLARAWVLLGEQLNKLHGSDQPPASALN